MHELERDVERRLVRGVKALGGTAYKWVCPGTVGVPDRIVVWPGGRVDFIELKTETGVLSPRQKIVLDHLRSLGCNVRVLRGSDAVAAYLLDTHYQTRVLRDPGDEEGVKCGLSRILTRSFAFRLSWTRLR